MTSFLDQVRIVFSARLYRIPHRDIVIDQLLILFARRTPAYAVNHFFLPKNLIMFLHLYKCKNMIAYDYNNVNHFC